jgi:hypothetical protein
VIRMSLLVFAVSLSQPRTGRRIPGVRSRPGSRGSLQLTYGSRATRKPVVLAKSGESTL